VVGGVEVGVVGELRPSVSTHYDVPGRVSLFEIDADLVLNTVGQKPHEATALSVFPAATQDLSLVVGASIPAEVLRATLAEGMGELVEDLHLVDDYRGEGIPEGHRSLTFSLRFRSADRTLTQAEATEAKEAGVALAKTRHGAVLRG
jgi:phenylalanyl-tRNA synthetase beta chain